MLRYLPYPYTFCLLASFGLGSLFGCQSSKSRVPEPIEGPLVESAEIRLANPVPAPVLSQDPPLIPNAPVASDMPKIAHVPDGSYLLKNVMSNKCFEFPESGKLNDPPRQFSCRGTSPQYFRIKRLGDSNRYMLQNVFSEKYLQIKGRSTDNGGQVEQAAVGSDAVQEFAFDRKAEAQYALRSLFSGKILDIADNLPDDGREIHQWDYVGQTNQVWQLILVGTIEPLP